MGINQSGQGYHVQFFHRFFLLQHTCQHFRVFRLRILIVFKPLRIDPVLTFFRFNCSVMSLHMSTAIPYAHCRFVLRLFYIIPKHKTLLTSILIIYF